MSRKRQTLNLDTEMNSGMTTRPSASGLQRNQQSSVRGKYQQQLQHYQQQEFTHTCLEYIKQICVKARLHPHTHGLPLRQILIMVTKILFVNELQLLFLSCLLQELGWPLSDAIITNSGHNLKRLLPDENPPIKGLELYLLLAAYSVKVYLNDSVKIFESELSQVMPSFYVTFQAWGAKFARPTLSVNPKRLNYFFVDHVPKMAKPSYQTYDDFNNKVGMLVENLPIPDMDSDYMREQQQRVKQEQQPNIITLNEEVSEYHWQIESMDDRKKQINNQNQSQIIEKMPSVGWPFRGDSVGSNANRQKWIENLPLSLTKRQSFESDLGLRSLHEQ